MKNGWGMRIPILAILKKEECIFQIMEMVFQERSIISLNVKKKGNVQQTGGHMNNLDTIREQMMF